LNDLVECHSGFEYAERPKALHWQGERLEIRKILKQWRQPGVKRFRVLTEDDQVFELSYQENQDSWTIVLT
jgi:hypothetical protein